MKIQSKSSKERLEFFKALYENALTAYSERLGDFDRCMRQYKGSTEIDGSNVRAATVRNITYEIVESQISSDIPSPKADAPSFSTRRERLSQAIERLCHSVRERLPFTKMNDLDERYTYIFGGSIWLVEWDNSLYKSGEVGGVSIQLISPRDFIPEPAVYDIDSMEYCFIRTTSTRGAMMRKYGISPADAALAEYDSEGEGEEADTVNIYIAFYRDGEGEVSRFIFSGELILSDLEGYYKRKISKCKLCGKSPSECDCPSPKILWQSEERELIFDKVGTGKPISVEYYTPHRFPLVIRKNTSSEGMLLGQSDCDYIRPQQQAINKIESRILQKLLRAGITPIVPEDASITLNNSVFGQIIKMKPGESMAQYGKVDTTPDISQDIAEAERLYEQAKQTLGISDAYQGLDFNSSESGYARQLRISQAGGRLESKKRMKYTAYAELDRLIFEHYLAFADEPRRLSYKDTFGRVHNEVFNRYDFLEYDIKCGKYFYDDDYLFSYDKSGEVYQRESLWERNLENLRSGTLGDPTAPSTLLRYWQSQERAHYPGARENVEYFGELIKNFENAGGDDHIQ